MGVGGDRGIGALVATSMLLVLSACGCDDPADEVGPIELPPLEPPAGSSAEHAPSDEPPPYRVAPGATGTVEGVVRWHGRRPGNPRLEVHAQHRVCGREQEVQAIEIGRGGGVKGAVVSLVDVHAGPRQPPRGAVQLDQVGCSYVPHTIAVMRGQPVVFHNSDDVLHNVHAMWEDGEQWLNVGQPRAGMSTTEVPTRSGVARVVCDAGHAWMLAWVHVFDHPYFAVTGEDGSFRLEEVPAGEQRIRLWHQGWEVVGQRSGRPHFADPVVVTRTVEVPADGTVTLDLELPPAAPEEAPQGS